MYTYIYNMCKLYLGVKSIWTQISNQFFFLRENKRCRFLQRYDGETRGAFGHSLLLSMIMLKFETTQHIRLHGHKLSHPAWAQLLPLWWIWSRYLDLLVEFLVIFRNAQCPHRFFSLAFSNCWKFPRSYPFIYFDDFPSYIVSMCRDSLIKSHI